MIETLTFYEQVSGAVINKECHADYFLVGENTHY